ncbi:hypothetical protein AV541_06505 [Thermus parvatiensis]|uniref:Uncharacterized protein n=1 Tax=Thermus parvatiensis TaxID=456163 RepID=A0A0X8D8E8_9DEIN|nr:hypothetical protein AV541_06505 [Thermus parvatiensis]
MEGPEFLQEGLPEVLGQEVEGFLVHGAGEGALLGFPVEGVEPAFFRAAVGLEALLQEAGDGALGRAHGTVEEEDAPFGAQAVGGCFERGHQAHIVAREWQGL